MNGLILRRREDNRLPPSRNNLLFKSLEIEIAIPSLIAIPVLVKCQKFAEEIQMLPTRPIQSNKDRLKTIV